MIYAQKKPTKIDTFIFALSLKFAQNCNIDNCIHYRSRFIEISSGKNRQGSFFFKICRCAPGVINFIYGHGSKIGPALTSHPKVSGVGFTGSSATSMKIASNATKTLKKVSMECGGKTPSVVFKNADLDHTVKILKRACFENNGQVCINAERIYVEEEVYQAFIEKFVEMVESDLIPNIGDPMDHKTEIGPLSSYEHWLKVRRMVETALENGARTINPGGFTPAGMATDQGSDKRTEIFLTVHG